MRHERRDEEPVEVSALPDLLRLTEEVLRTGRPRALRRDGETVAMLVPLSKASGRQQKGRTLTAEDVTAFREAAGSWADIDVERFLADVYAARNVPDERPAVEL